jgi:glycerol-3-phosphate dehydrogenase
MIRSFDAIIIGGGAVGCAIAYRLSRYDLRIALLERNPDVCMGTSGKNSGVVHAGFNNRTGSLMAEFCVDGNKRFEQICRTLDVPYKKTGKLVVALDESDLPIIDELLEAGERNGCVGLSKVGRAGIDETDPYVRGLAALYSSNTAIVNPFLYTIHLAEAACRNGVEFFMDSEVTAIERGWGVMGAGFSVSCGDVVFRCAMLINSAGLYSDKVAAMAGDTQYRIYPSRGEYFVLDKQATEITGRPVYPVPRKGVGGLGVHLTPTTDGNMLIGPSAEYVNNCEEYATTRVMMDSLFSEAKELLPELSRSMIIGAYTGIRSKTVPPGSANFGDFIIDESVKSPGMINLVGIESPGLTASMPIAERVCRMLDARFGFSERADWKAEYKGNPVFRLLDVSEQRKLIGENPAYGEIVCRCENVTKAEVICALNNPLGARTLVSIKNRVRTMMGRCQGGYCYSNLADVLRGEFGISAQDICYRGKGDRPFFGPVK